MAGRIQVSMSHRYLCAAVYRNTLHDKTTQGIGLDGYQQMSVTRAGRRKVLSATGKWMELEMISLRGVRQL